MTKNETTGKTFTAKFIRSLTCPAHMKQQPVAVLPNVHLYVSVGRGGTKAFCFRCKENGNWKTLDLDCRFDDSLPRLLLEVVVRSPFAAGRSVGVFV